MYTLFVMAMMLLPSGEAGGKVLKADERVNILLNTTCHRETATFPRCEASGNNCAFMVKDGMFEDWVPGRILEIANKGFMTRPLVGGPGLVDVNTGYIRDSGGLDNLFSKMNEGADIFTSDDFAVYGRTITTLKESIEELFGLEELFFTAPTFITRLDGRSDWEPKEEHDEYWHSHVDRLNTAHYHYSGLLYLSDFDKDFTNGRFVLLDSDGDEELILEPRAGRVALFSSGEEHEHYVERLGSGARYVLSFW